MSREVGAVARPAVRRDVLATELDGVRILWDPVGRQVHQLNATAAAVYDRCDGTQTPDELAAAVGPQFGAAPTEVLGDVRALLDELAEADLLDDGPPPAPRPEAPVPVPRTTSTGRLASRVVQARSWPSICGPYRGFDFSFDVAVDDDGLAHELVDALVGLRSDDAGAEHRYSIRTRAGTRTVLSLDGTPLLRAPLGRAVDYLYWHTNRMSARSTPDRVVLHTGAVAIDDTIVLLPADSGHGKSTLTAGLCLAGAEYLTDECVALDPVSATVAPYAKPVTLERGSWPWFPDLDALAPAGSSDRQRQIGSGHLPAGTGSAGVPGCVVFPRYQAGSGTETASLTPAETLVELLRHTFAFDELGAKGLVALRDLAGSVPGYRLTSGDLGGAVGAVEALVSGP